MSIPRMERRQIESALQVSTEDIEDMLETYPTAAIKIAVKEECLAEVLERFSEIARDYGEMKKIIKHILDYEKDGIVKISPSLRKSMEEVTKRNNNKKKQNKEE